MENIILHVYYTGEKENLQATEEEIETTLKAIGISDEPDENGIYYEEYFIMFLILFLLN